MASSAFLMLYYICQVYIWILIARMIISWIPLLAPNWRPTGIVVNLFDLIYTLTDPPIRFFRRFIPPLNFGTISLDLGFMLLFVAVLALQRLSIYLMYAF